MNPHTRKIPIENAAFTYITDDSRIVDSKGAFLRTQLNQKYEQEARERGCTHFVSPRFLWEHFAPFARIVGITGTNGKTTTAAAIYSILLDLGYSVALLGTRGFFINNQQIAHKSLTTPPVFEIFTFLLEAKQRKCDFFIMEVSSHAIAQNRIEGLEFALKILTNITSDHLDFHKTTTEYVATKNAFFGDSTLKLINKDESHAAPNPANMRTYAIETPATYSIAAYSFKDGISAQIIHSRQNVSLFSPLFGRHNLYNLLAAVAAVHLLTNATLERIVALAENFGGVKGRMEVVHSNPLIIVDFAHTEDGMRQIFESFLHRNIVVVFGAGGDRDTSKRPKMGAIAEKYATKIYLTNDNPRTESPQAILDEILSGIHDTSKCVVEPDRRQAIHRAIAALAPDDVLLILGKGDEDEQILADKRIACNDAEIVAAFFKP